MADSSDNVESALNRQFNVLQVNDLEKKNVPKTEDDIARTKLAAVYRLIDLKGWGFSVYNHITIRCKDPEHFLINPYGLLYSEITASNLLKINEKCEVIERGTSTYGVNKAGFTLHSTIHSARPDVNAIIHLHTGLAAGISTLKCGLLPITQEAFLCGHVSYHDYQGILVDDSEREAIKANLGPKNKVMILRNHGVVVCGNTIEEAWFFLLNFMAAVSNQFHAMAAANGIENIVVPSKDVLAKVQKVLTTGINEKASDEVQWKLGEMELEAEMRKMDSMGYNTGYEYKKKN